MPNSFQRQIIVRKGDARFIVPFSMKNGWFGIAIRNLKTNELICYHVSADEKNNGLKFEKLKDEVKT